ncbi:MAG: DMT family transporter [Acetobacteraceae bacterium]|nr:DMT family transporter [Acetobacteraceae bacterium]
MSGPAWMALGIAVFALLDLDTKWLSAGYGMGQVLLLRYGVMLLVLAPFCATSLLRARTSLHLLRGILMFAVSAGFYTAFANLPLFDGYVVYFTAPFMVMALGRLMLGEQVPPAAWGWAAFGFAGVVLALVPRLAHDALRAAWPLLAAFVGTIAYALVMILTRRAAQAPLGVLLLWPGIVGTVAAAPLAALEWVTPTPLDALLLAISGVLWAGAIGCLSRAVQLSPPSRLAPIDFTAVVWVIAFDRIVFGHVAGVPELTGAAMVIGACLMHARAMTRSAA